MRSIWLVAAALGVVACGSQSEQQPGPASGGNDAFPPPLPGYVRIAANTIENIPPGGDVTKCQYLMAPLDHDVDVVDVVGYQSEFGHHLIAMTYAASPGEETGTEYSCMGSDIGGASLAKTGQFLGAAANGKRSNVSPPEGVALRLKKGIGVQVNMHFINTGTKPINGDGVIDLKMVPTDASKPVASLFANNIANLEIPPGGQSTSSVDCPVQSEIKFVMVGSHMHEHGLSAKTEVVHEDGTITNLHTDEDWPADAVSNPTFSHYPLSAPAVVRPGDIVRTSCTYMNSTADTLTFPNEMCSAVGMALSDNPEGTVPSCIDGNWVPLGF